MWILIDIDCYLIYKDADLGEVSLNLFYKIWDNVWDGGGGVIHLLKMSQFPFGNFINPDPGGGLNFSEMTELKVALRHHGK